MKKLIFPALLIIAVAVIGFQNSEFLQNSVLRFGEQETLTTNDIREVIENGTSWFKNSQEKSGHFKYEYMPFLDRYIDEDNMVRQAGGLYVLGELFRNDTENKLDLEKTITKAISYFESNTTEGELNGESFRCLLKYEGRCTLGGTSLALVGIIDLVQSDSSYKSDYKNLIEDYKDYLMAMRVGTKGFRDSYYTEKEQSTKESSFSNGEAFLALTRYYQYNPDEEVKEVLDEAFHYFEKIYRAEWDNNYYLWGMAAIKDLYAMDPKEEYYEFVKDYTDWRIDYYKGVRGTLRNRCAYIEGVTSAYSVLEPNLTTEEKEYYMEEIDFWLAKSKELQVDKGDFLRISYNYNFLTKQTIDDEEKAIGGFLTATTEQVQRIDFTQHCLNSYLQKLVDIDGKSL
jgi:hypothetical protein